MLKTVLHHFSLQVDIFWVFPMLLWLILLLTLKVQSPTLITRMDKETAKPSSRIENTIDFRISTQKIWPFGNTKILIIRPKQHLESPFTLSFLFQWWTSITRQKSCPNMSSKATRLFSNATFPPLWPTLSRWKPGSPPMEKNTYRDPISVLEHFTVIVTYKIVFSCPFPSFHALFSCFYCDPQNLKEMSFLFPSWLPTFTVTYKAQKKWSSAFFFPRLSFFFMKIHQFEIPARRRAPLRLSSRRIHI